MARGSVERTKDDAISKYDAFVERQLEKARRRVRFLDLLRSLLIGGLLILGYALLVPALDAIFGLSQEARLWIALAFFVVLVVYLGYAVSLFVFRTINPYYAARRLEKTLPDAKESVTNWIDLHEEKLPAAFRGAVSLKAVKDLKRADFDHVEDTRPVWYLVVGAAVLLLVLAVWLIREPSQMTQRLRRAFVPIDAAPIPRYTRLEMISPKNGDGEVEEGQPVLIRVRISGWVPPRDSKAAAKLYYRYQPGDPYRTRPLYPRREQEWSAQLDASQVLGGRVWYKISAGDAETPEYLIRVRTKPRILRYVVDYQPRPYRRFQQRTVGFPNDDRITPEIKDYAGTEVTLRVFANSRIQNARLEIEQTEKVLSIPGEVSGSEPQSATFQFVLEESGSARVVYSSKEAAGQIVGDGFPVLVLPDAAPRVTITKPGKDVSLPANGVLAVEGYAEDDFGIRRLALHANVEGDVPVPLKPKTYRKGKSFRLPDGSYPQALTFRETLKLDRLQRSDGKPVTLRAGDILSYWMEAVDSCDYPEPSGQVVKSKVYRVKIAEAMRDKEKLEQMQKQAEQLQRQHEQQQDQDFKKLQEQVKRQQQSQQTGGNRNNRAEDPELQKKLDQLAKAEKEAKRESSQSGKQGQAEQAGAGKDGKGRENAGSAKNSGKPQEQKPGQGKTGPSREQNGGQAKGGGKRRGEQQPQPQAGKTKTGSGEGAKSQAKAPPKPGGKGAGQKRSSSKQGGEQGASKTAAKGAERSDSGPTAGAKQGDRDQPSPQVGKTKDAAGSQQTAGSAKKDTANKGGSAATKTANQGKSGSPKTAAKTRPSGGKDQPPGTTKTAGQQKDGSKKRSGSQPAVAKGAKDSSKNNGAGNSEALKKQVEQLAKQLASAKGEARKDLERQLQELAKKADDPAIREQIRKAMEAARKQGAETNPKLDRQTLEKLAKLREQLGGKDETQRKQALKDLEKLKNSTDPEIRQAAEKLAKQIKDGKLVKAKSPAGGGQKGQPRYDDTGKRIDPDARFAKRAGNLQLEDLKRKLADPEIRKTLQQRYNWSDADVQRFLADMKNYLQRQSSQSKLPRPGSLTSRIGGTRLERVIGRIPQSGLDDPLGRAPVPREYEEAWRRFNQSRPKR